MNASNEASGKRGMFSMALLHSVVLAVIAIGSVYEWQKGGVPVTSSVYILFYVHVALSLISGQFKGAIATTWILLFVVFGLKQALALMGGLVPFGALNAQIQQEPTIGQYAMNFYENIAFMGISGISVGLLVFLLFIGLNVAARFSLRENSEGMTERVLGIVAVLIVTIIVATTLFGGSDAITSSPNDKMDWYLAPFASALRAVPGENGGLIAMIAMLIAPMLAIFITQAKSGSTKWLIRLLLLLSLVGFVGLGYYGGQPGDEQVLLRSQILLVCFFAYFAIAPFLTSKAPKQA